MTTPAMNILAFFVHLLNFAAPAGFVGTFVALTAPWVLRKTAGRGGWKVRALSNSLCGLLALAAGLWFFDHDGKMASYGGLLVASTASQLLWMRAGR